jgi:hypothetical protein
MQETPSCRTTPEHPLHQDFLDPRIADTGKTLVASPSEHLRRCSISLPQWTTVSRSNLNCFHFWIVFLILFEAPYQKIIEPNISCWH